MTACPTPTNIPHATRADAAQHLRGLRARGGSPDLNVYHCACGAFHVGHSAWSLRRRIRQALRRAR